MAIASVASDAATEVFTPASEEEAIAAFGDGTDVVVVGGGTIVVPDLTYRRLEPTKALLLGRAGLSGIEQRRLARHDRGDDAGAGRSSTCPRRSARARRTSPTSRSARRRPSAGTSAPARATKPRAATCRVRSSRSARRPARRPTARSPRSRSRTSSRSGASASSSASASRSPPRARTPASTGRTRTTTRRSPSRARASADGTVRLAATGAGSHGQRLPSAEGGDAEAALNDVTPHDDALASAWYRSKVLPVLVRRVLDRAEGVRMNLTVNGVAHEVGSSELTPLLDVLRDELGRHRPEGRLPPGRLRRVHRARRRRAAPLVPPPCRLRRRDTDHDGRGHRARRRTSRRSSRRSSTTTPRSAASARPG